MEQIDKGQVNTQAAEIYEAFFVPALFQEWADKVLDLTTIRAGHNVLDVACGTGILARTAKDRVGTSGSVIGLDINEGMLAVAKSKAPGIEWRQGAAENQPIDSNSFDAVVSQFGLMFFEDRHKAIQEIYRVVKPGGSMTVAVWDSLENTPGYAAMVALLQRLFGEEVANGLRAPYILGDKNQLNTLFAQGLGMDVTITTQAGMARFPSIESWVYTDIKGWVLADVLDDDQIATLLQAAEQELTAYVTADGSVAFNAPAHIITIRK